ncbi:MAG: hypothetical protein ACKO96_27630, partial [Flammeovirgaceae bacterium]
IAQKKLTLEDAWLKYSFFPKSAQGFNVQSNGLTYVDIDGEDANPVLSQFEIKSGKKLKELVKQSDIKFKDRTLDLNSYRFDPTETK